MSYHFLLQLFPLLLNCTMRFQVHFCLMNSLNFFLVIHYYQYPQSHILHICWLIFLEDNPHALKDDLVNYTHLLHLDWDSHYFILILNNPPIFLLLEILILLICLLCYHHLFQIYFSKIMLFNFHYYLIIIVYHPN